VKASIGTRDSTRRFRLAEELVTRRARAIACGAVLAHAASAASEPPQSLFRSAEPIDFAALATATKTVEIREELLRAVVAQDDPDAVKPSAVLDLGDGVAAVAWSECSKTSCRGWVGRLTGGPEYPKLATKVALAAPHAVLFADGFTFDAPAFTDFDGDGAPEIIVRYRAIEPPRAALGSLSHDYVAIYAPKRLSLVFTRELRSAGAPSEQACECTLARRGDMLLATTTCSERSCLEAKDPPARCKPATIQREIWHKAKHQNRYMFVGRQPAKPSTGN
jgi:hypothetical protein